MSATSIQSYEGCSRRFFHEKVEYVDTPGDSVPALKGSAVHEALETYVQAAYVDKSRNKEDWPFLERQLQLAFAKLFRRTGDDSDPDYKDCVDMLQNWYDRSFDLERNKTKVIEVEVKREIMFDVNGKKVPFRFVFDRVEESYENGKRILRVVDYKTWRANYNSEQLRQKVQCKLYGLAAQMHYNADDKYDEIWVCFDQLRWSQVEVRISKEENRKTYKYMKDVIRRILEEAEPGKETVNEECMFCLRKATCKAFLKNVEAGGIFAIATDRDALAARALELESAAKAIKYAQEEIAEVMLRDGMESGEIDWSTENFEVTFRSQKRKRYDPQTIREIVGDKVFSDMGKINNSEIDKLLASEELTPAQKSMIRQSAEVITSEPKAKITRKIVK